MDLNYFRTSLDFGKHYMPFLKIENYVPQQTSELSATQWNPYNEGVNNPPCVCAYPIETIPATAGEGMTGARIPIACEPHPSTVGL